MSYLPEDYESVEDRIRDFYADHPQGRINTAMVERANSEVVFRAEVFRELDIDPHPAATGHAHGFLGQAKDLEKTETVAIGRALANLNYAKQGRRMSREEAQAFEEVKAKTATRPHGGSRPGSTATPGQIEFVRALIATVEEGPELAAQYIGSTPLEFANRQDVSRLIDDLKERKAKTLAKVTRSTESDEAWYTQEPPNE
jgi:hypothetical protein